MSTKFENFSIEELQNLIVNCHSLNEFAKKLGYASCSGATADKIKEKIIEYGLITNHFSRKAATHWELSDIFCKDSLVSQKHLRKTFKENQYILYECSICHLPPEWNGKELTLTLDHIDGNNKNNQIENLRWTCPNCDRQLDTFGAKNHKMLIKKEVLHYCEDCGIQIFISSQRCKECNDIYQRHIDNRPTRDELKALIRTQPFTTIGKTYHISDNAIRKWCIAYKLPSTKKVIKSILDIDWEKI